MRHLARAPTFTARLAVLSAALLLCGPVAGALLAPLPAKGKGAILHLRMNGAAWTGKPNEVVDVSGHGNHGTAKGGATTVADGKFGRAGSFKGKNYVECPNTKSMNFTRGMTLEAWVKPQSTTSGLLCVKGKWRLIMVDGNRPRLKISTPGRTVWAPSRTMLRRGQWHHVAVTYDPAGTALVYADGQERKGVSFRASALPASADPLRIGSGLKALIDEVVVYNRVLTDREIYEHYALGFAKGKVPKPPDRRECRINLASSTRVQASSNQFRVGRMFDKTPRTCWVAAPDDPKPTLLVTLEAPRRIDRVRLYQQYWFYSLRRQPKSAEDLKERGSFKRFRISVLESKTKQWRVVDDHSKTPLPYDRRQLVRYQAESRYYEAAFRPVTAGQVKIEFLESYEPPVRVSHLLVLEAPQLPGYDNYPFPDWIFYYNEGVLKELGIKCPLPRQWRDYNLKLDYKGMEPVREAVKRAIRAAGDPKKADYTLAKKALLEYYRNRKLNRTARANRPSRDDLKRYDFTSADKALQKLWRSTSFAGNRWWPYCAKKGQWDRIHPDWVRVASRDYWFPWGPADRWTDQYLARAYHVSRDEKYASALVEQLTEWLMAHPFPRRLFHLSYRGRRPQHRMHPWLSVMIHAPHSRHVTPGFLNLFLKTVAFHWKGSSLGNTFGKTSGWGCEQAHVTNAGWFLGAALAFGELNCMPSAKNCTYAGHRSFELTGYPDGALRLPDTGYGLSAFSAWFKVWALCRTGGVPMDFRFEQAMAANLRWLVGICKPDGELPLLGGCASSDIRGKVRAAIGLCGDDVLADTAPALLYLASDRKKGAPPDFVSFPPENHSYAGRYVMRSDWGPDARYLLMVAGPKGIEHAKADQLHLAVAAYGRTFLDGTKGELYHSIHQNTVSVDHTTGYTGGQSFWRGPQNPAMPPQTMRALKMPWVTCDVFDSLEGRYDQSYFAVRGDNVTHHRAVFFAKPDYWIVLDRLTAGKDHKYHIWYHLLGEPRLAQDAAAKALRTTFPEGANLAVVPCPRSDVRNVHIKPRAKVLARAAQAPGWTVRYEVAGKDKALATVLFPLKPGSRAEVSCKALDLPNGKPGHTLAMEVRIGRDRRDVFLYARDRGAHKPLPNVESKARTAFVSFERGRVKTMALVSGTRLAAGKFEIRCQDIQDAGLKAMAPNRYRVYVSDITQLTLPYAGIPDDQKPTVFVNVPTKDSTMWQWVKVGEGKGGVARARLSIGHYDTQIWVQPAKWGKPTKKGAPGTPNQ